MSTRTATPLVWLQAWRASHALTQGDAAAIFGVHIVTYAKWEVGLFPLQGAALRLAEVLQTPQGYRLAKRLLRQRA